MIISLPRGKREYIVRAEAALPKSEQTVFLLDDLTERDRVAIMDTLTVSLGDETTMGGTGTRVYTCLKAGLKGWRNLYDVEGNEVTFKLNGSTITDDSLVLLPWEVKVELQEELLNGAFLSEADKEK
ncbi:hypothetical protein K0U83_15495 [bacterium]|nr:hypothetical protein [bacterium]